MDDFLRPSVRISDSGGIAAALPSLLGFHPHESVVLVSLTGPSGHRVGLTVRADLPPPSAAPDLARTLARSVATDGPVGVVVAVVSETPDEPMPDLFRSEDPGAVVDGLDGEPVTGLPHRAVVHDLVVALAERDIPVREALLVRAGRWWSYDCPHPCCAPGAGTPLPGGVSELEAASVASGVVVEPNRAALEARIARIDGPAMAAMEAVTWRVGARLSRAVPADRESRVERSWATIVRAVRRCRAGGAGAAEPLGDREVARVLWALADVQVRDRALGLALGEDAAAAETLWTECTRRGPTPLDAAPATLLAVSVWLRGDGAMANVALERALDSRPGYTLAELLAQGLAACMPPADLRGMIAAAVEDLGDTRAAG